ncbi:sporulation protein [Bacillus altitudinis]|uniref:sporulation protein n=1 Tax=Bacillus altitudinis TaxID=293387 RepID=UPI0039A346B5
MKKILAGVVIFGLILITFFYVFSRTSEIFDENRAEKLLLSPANESISYEIDDKDTVEDLIEELNKGKQTSNHLKKNLKKPDYIAKVMFGRTNGTSFQLWTNRIISRKI